MRTLETRNGYTKFWRLGPLTFHDQSRWHTAPTSKGLWAFPYPHYEPFFTNHKYHDLLPKSLQEDETPYEEKEAWIKKYGRKVLPIREFWYKGDLYSHFTPSGEIAYVDEWYITDSHTLTQHIRKTNGTKVTLRLPDGSIVKHRSSADHLEVFIAKNMGTIKEGTPHR